MNNLPCSQEVIPLRVESLQLFAGHAEPLAPMRTTAVLGKNFVKLFEVDHAMIFQVVN